MVQAHPGAKKPVDDKPTRAYPFSSTRYNCLYVVGCCWLPSPRSVWKAAIAGLRGGATLLIRQLLWVLTCSLVLKSVPNSCNDRRHSSRIEPDPYPLGPVESNIRFDVCIYSIHEHKSADSLGTVSCCALSHR